MDNRFIDLRCLHRRLVLFYRSAVAYFAQGASIFRHGAELDDRDRFLIFSKLHRVLSNETMAIRLKLTEGALTAVATAPSKDRRWRNEGHRRARRWRPPPWSVEGTGACFIVRDASGHALAYAYFEDEPSRRAAAHLLTGDEARRIPEIAATRRNWSRRRLARMRIDSPKHPNQAYAETSPAAAMPQASVAERPVCAPALVRRSPCLRPILATLHMISTTLAEALKYAAAACHGRPFSLACQSNTSLPGTKPVQLGTPTRNGPSRGRVAH